MDVKHFSYMPIQKLWEGEVDNLQSIVRIKRIDRVQNEDARDTWCEKHLETCMDSI